MGCPLQNQLLLMLLLLLLLLLQLPGHLGQVTPSQPLGPTATAPPPTSPAAPTEVGEGGAAENTSLFNATAAPSAATSLGPSMATGTGPSVAPGPTGPGPSVAASTVGGPVVVVTEEEKEEEVVEKEEEVVEEEEKVVEEEEEEEVVEEEDWSPAEAYLHSADASALALSACPRSYRLPPPRGRPPPDLGPLLRPVGTSLANVANFLNLIFQASELRETSIQEDLEWYHALVRSLLEGDRPGLVRRALLTFDADPVAVQPQLVLRASQGPRGVRSAGGPRFFPASAPPPEIFLQDFSGSWESLHPLPPAPDDSWFTALKFTAPPQVLAGLSKRVLVNDLLTLQTPKWARGDSYVTNSSAVRWADTVFLECEDGRFLPGWLLTLTMPFYGLKPDLSPEFRGVIRADVNIQGYDIDQCATGDLWFANTHECNRTSMVCESIPGQGFRLGQYCCRCKEGFYSPARTKHKTGGRANGTRACYPSKPVCLPCWPGCPRCEDGSPCRVQEDWLLRAAMLTVQGLFMVLVFLSMLVTYQNRGSKRIRASGLLLLEMILFGSLLLYFPVFILFFRPSTFRCILLRWVRMLGFTIVYGTMTLKMYRVLKVFLSRTAQRVPYMSSTSLLRLLGVMVATVSWFLCAWTSGVLQNRDRNVPLLVTSTTSNGQQFSQCDIDRWDYMMALAERLFLCWGLFLCSAVKPVPSAFHEPRYMSIAIHNEMFLSCMFQLLRFSNHNLHPDWTLLLEFTHTHATITVTLGLLFAPKFLHVSQSGRGVIAAEVYEDEVDLRRSYLNHSFTSGWSDHSVEPEDIRDELKKLYSQLEIHKTKKMANNNPHLTKKSSSRLGIGRSIIKRIADFPETISRQHSREDRSSTHSPSPSLFSSASKKPTEIAYVNYKDDYSKSPNMLPKSQGSFDYVRSRTPSIAGSLTPILVDKRASQYSQHSQYSQYSQLSQHSQHSQHSQAESFDTSPVVCKSASAHNLAVDKNFLHPDDSRHQKSMSVVVSSTDYYAMMMGEAAQSGATTPELKHFGSIKEQTTRALLAESFDKAEVCPWEVEEERRPSKKHVTISISQNEGDVSPEKEKAPASPSLVICPWENTDTSPEAAKQKSIDSTDSDGDSVKLRAPISASAPVSPSATQGKHKDLRVFSFRSATKGLLTAKGIMTDKVKLTATFSVDVVKKTPQLQRRSMSTVDGKPSLQKQNAVRLSSTDSAERSPYRLANPEVLICPWESDLELPDTKNQDSVYIPQSSLKKESPRTDGRRRPSLSGSQLTVGPADGTPPNTLQVPPRQLSIVADVCPWEVPEPQASNTNADVCPWDAPDVAVPQATQDSGRSNTGGPKPAERVIYVNNARGTTQPGSTAKRLDTVSAEVCPWDSAEPVQVQDGARANVCPWESEEPAGVGDKKIAQSEIKKSPQVTQQVTTNADACPWDFPEQPDPGKINICPWEAEAPKPQLSKQTAVVHSSQESINNKTGPKESPKLQQHDTICPNVCPWETADSPSPKDGEATTCPVPVKAAPKILSTPSSQTTTTAEACPWDFPAPPAPADVSPWESDNVEPQPPQTGKITRRLSRQGSTYSKTSLKFFPKQESVRENVRESQEPERSSQQDSTKADVCPWETDSATKTLPKQDGTKADVCPWETDSATKTLPKQDGTKADVCPWETDSATITLPKQDGTKADVCPWETESTSKTLQKQESTKADVCPWETEGTVKGSTGDKPTQQGGVSADVCPWDTDAPKEQDGARADVCPWDTDAPKEQDGARADVCPWETGGTEKAKAEESSGAAGTTPSKENTEDSAVTTEEQGNLQSPTESSQALDTERTNSPLERRDALCPWPAERTEHDNSDVFTWEENIPEEDEDLDAECAAEAFVFPPDLD